MLITTALLLSVTFAGCVAKRHAAVEKKVNTETYVSIQNDKLEPQVKPVVKPKKVFPENWGYIVVDIMDDKESPELTAYMDEIHEYVYKAWRPILNRNIHMRPLMEGHEMKVSYHIRSNGTYIKSVMYPEYNGPFDARFVYNDRNIFLTQIAYEAVRGLEIKPLPNDLPSIWLTISFVYKYN